MTGAEKLFISAINGTNVSIIASLRKEWLEGAEIKQHRYILDYYREHGELVGVKTFCSEFGLDASEADSSPDHYLNVIIDRYIQTTLLNDARNSLKKASDDPRAALREMQDIISGLVTEATESEDSLYSEDTDDRRADYEEKMECGGVTYLSMGSHDMDESFYGYKRGDLITFGGKAGTMKTWLMIYLAMQLEKEIIAKEEATGKLYGDVLFLTLEMPIKEIKERMDVYKFKLPYTEFMSGKLEKNKRGDYYRGLEELEEKGSKLKLIGNCYSLDELTTKIGLYKPSAVFIDGSYLMENQKNLKEWEKILFVTRNLKIMAKKFNIPIINSTQLKRGTKQGASKIASDGQDDFAYGSSYTQDSDFAFRMYRDAKMVYECCAAFEVAKGRRSMGVHMVFQNDLALMKQSITRMVDTSTSDLGELPEVWDPLESTCRHASLSIL